MRQIKYIADYCWFFYVSPQKIILRQKYLTFSKSLIMSEIFCLKVFETIFWDKEKEPAGGNQLTQFCD